MLTNKTTFHLNGANLVEGIRQCSQTRPIRPANSRPRVLEISHTKTE